MSIKILDSDCAINLLEKMKSFNCIPFLSSYDTIITEDVLNELRRGNSFKGAPFEIYSLSDKEIELFNDTTDYMSKLGRGERSAMVHALFLSNEHSCENSDKIIVLSNDKEANHIFHNELCRNPSIGQMFPNLDKIIWSRTVDIL